MKKIIILLCTLSWPAASFSSLKVENSLSQDHLAQYQKDANTYAQQCVQLLTPQEFQLLANVMYFSCAFASLDHQVRSYTSKLLAFTHHMNTEIQTYVDSSVTQESLIQGLTILKKAATMRQEVYKGWQQCIIHSEQQTSQTFMTALQTWQEAVQQCMLAYAHHNDEALTESLNENVPALAYQIEKLGDIHDAYQDLTEKIMRPITRSDFIAVTKTGLSSQLGMQGQMICADIFKTVDPLIACHNALQKVAADIMGVYYQALYEELQKHDTAYHTILFDNQGFIGQEKSIELLPFLAN